MTTLHVRHNLTTVSESVLVGKLSSAMGAAMAFDDLVVIYNTNRQPTMSLTLVLCMRMQPMATLMVCMSMQLRSQHNWYNTDYNGIMRRVQLDDDNASQWPCCLRSRMWCTAWSKANLQLYYAAW